MGQGLEVKGVMQAGVQPMRGGEGDGVEGVYYSTYYIIFTFYSHPFPPPPFPPHLSPFSLQAVSLFSPLIIFLCSGAYSFSHPCGLDSLLSNYTFPSRSLHPSTPTLLAPSSPGHAITSEGPHAWVFHPSQLSLYQHFLPLPLSLLFICLSSLLPSSFVTRPRHHHYS